MEVRRVRPRLLFAVLLPLQFLNLVAAAGTADEISVVVSIPEQRLYVVKESGQKLNSYRISTSRFGLGDRHGSYATPTGQLEIAKKIGTGATPGAVFKQCRYTGEVCPVNAKGRDPIVTRVLPLRGLEKNNSLALSRGIFIHGTPDERNIGRPVSYGCIRMKSRDVIELFDTVRKGTRVEITTDRVGGLFGASIRLSPKHG
jgi:lipoprotein-anchoring transpeptidase ErfK/SrfK